MSARTFHVQGHRGAKATHPENTLAGFEAALRAGADSVETDLHPTADGVPVLTHDPYLTLGGRHAVHERTLAELRDMAGVLCPPTLDEFLTFATAFGGDAVLDLELKFYPYRCAALGATPFGLEAAVLDAVRRFGVAGRVAVRSFDHRIVRRLRQAEPRLTGVVLVADTAIADPVAVARAADAQVFAPDFEFVDEAMVAACRAAGVRVLPWTVNEPADWERLAAWGVAGVTTDDPAQCVAWKKV